MSIVLVVAGSMAASVYAHHSYSEYDDTKSVEVEGKLLDADWRNPHARILVEAIDESGKRVVWDIESALTEPVEGKRSWVWRPDERVMPFNCTSNAQ